MLSLVLVVALQCGVERSDVKHLTDPLAAKIDFTVLDTTIEALAALPLAHPVQGHEPRGVRPEEFHVYRVEGVVTVAKYEQDQDIHLGLRGDGGGRTIAEFVDARCAAASFGLKEIRSARHDLDRLLSDNHTVAARNLSWLIGKRVRIAGVAYFDPIHGQRGIARNGVEVHPVLAIERIR